MKAVKDFAAIIDGVEVKGKKGAEVKAGAKAVALLMKLGLLKEAKDGD